MATLLTDADVCLLLQVKPRKLARLVRENQIPHICLPDGELRFDEADIEHWVNFHKREVLVNVR